MRTPLPFLSAGVRVIAVEPQGGQRNEGENKCACCAQSKCQGSTRRGKKPPIQRRVSLMSGQQPWQAPDRRWYSSGDGSPPGPPSRPPGWPEQPRKEKPEKESKLVSFREWLSTTAGVIAAICAIITLLGGTIVVVKILAPHNNSTIIQDSPTPTPPHSTSPNSPSPFTSAQLQSALLSSETVGSTATVESSGTDVSTLETTCGGPRTGATATAYESINDQQTGTFLAETITSWDRAADAGQAIKVDRQAVDQSGSCSITSSGATEEYSGDDAGSPPSSCVSPGQYFATQINTTSSSFASPYNGFFIQAQCGTTTITVKIESDLPGGITQQSADGYLSSAIGKLDSVT